MIYIPNLCLLFTLNEFNGLLEGAAISGPNKIKINVQKGWRARLESVYCKIFDSSKTRINNSDLLPNNLTTVNFKEHLNYLHRICINHECRIVKPVEFFKSNFLTSQPKC